MIDDAVTFDDAVVAHDAMQRHDAQIASIYWQTVQNKKPDSVVIEAWERVKPMVPWAVPDHPFGWWAWQL